MNNHNNTLYLDEKTSAYIITALLIASNIITVISENKNCLNCKLLKTILGIIKRLKNTSSFNGHISLFPIQYETLSETNTVLCDSPEEDEICKKVWELLQELFNNPVIAEEIIAKLKQILTNLHVQLEREE